MCKARIAAAFIFLSLFSGIFHYSASAEALNTKYNDYIENNGGVLSTPEEQHIDISASALIADQSKGTEIKDGSFIVSESGSATFGFTVGKPGLYRIAFDFISLVTGTRNISFGVKIDDKIPFTEASNFELHRIWMDEGAIQSDEQGNDISPNQIEYQEWQTYNLSDNEGLNKDPYLFYFSEGMHTVTFDFYSEPVKLKNIVMYTPAKAITYDEYLEQNKDIAKYTGEKILVEGEAAKYKSEMYIIAQNDMSSPYTTPYSAGKLKLNTFGGANWKMPHETVTWEVTVPQTGLYKISARYRQNFYQGIKVHRRIYVNGQVPFAEAEDIAFKYYDGWQSDLLGDYYIKLEKGTNTISLECVLGSSTDILAEMQEAVFKLNSIYRSIVMVTGSIPDNYRDYALDKEIPGLIDNLKESSKLLNTLADSIIGDYGKNSRIAAQIMGIERQLQDMIKHPSNISKSERLDSFKSNISEIGTWISMFREQPLEIDSLLILPDGGVPAKGEASVIDEAIHRFKRFIASFFEDYSSISKKKDGKSIKVWIQAGRDQANILKQMITSDFTPASGVNVQMELVVGSIIESTLAGKGPDVVLNCTDTDPVNFAMRGALYDISTFTDFNTIKTQFIDGAFTPYQYNGGYYGVPERMNFDMMFYRTDILEELSLTPPKTWNEMLMEILPVLNRHNMEIGIGNINKVSQMNSSNIFTNLLYQKGGQIYSNDLTKTALDGQVAYEAFQTAVNMYKDYMLPQEYDAMNRFRTGIMPILIAPYTTYNTFAITVPELAGLWKMSPIPGTVKDNGEIDISQAVSGSAAVMFKGARDKAACWEFLKWWASTDTQAKFGIRQEAALGPAGRYDTANLPAMERLPWDNDQLESLSTQLRYCVTVPQLPGSYFTSRALNNAFLTCVLDKKSPREQLLYWNDQINLELDRKRIEFNNNSVRISK